MYIQGHCSCPESLYIWYCVLFLKSYLLKANIKCINRRYFPPVITRFGAAPCKLCLAGRRLFPPPYTSGTNLQENHLTLPSKIPFPNPLSKCSNKGPHLFSDGGDRPPPGKALKLANRRQHGGVAASAGKLDVVLIFNQCLKPWSQQFRVRPGPFL